MNEMNIIMNGITLRHETRPCVIRGKRATFHRWTERDGRPYAIVEWDGGHVGLVTPEKVRFTDRMSFEERMKELMEGM